MKYRFISGILLVFLIGCFSAACSISSDTAALKIDSPVPDFKLTDLNGKTVSLSDFTGKTLLINFWATTCAPCVSEMPVLQEFSDSISGTDVAFVSINLGEDLSRVQDFMRKNQYSFSVLLDSQYEVAGKYNVRSYPATYFIDKNGLLKANIVGPFKNKAAIDRQIASFLP